jgi:hypothetical protein
MHFSQTGRADLLTSATLLSVTRGLSVPFIVLQRQNSANETDAEIFAGADAIGRGALKRDRKFKAQDCTCSNIVSKYHRILNG